MRHTIGDFSVLGHNVTYSNRLHPVTEVTMEQEGTNSHVEAHVLYYFVTDTAKIYRQIGKGR